MDELLTAPPRLALDPCAGAGIFGAVLAEEAPDVLRWGIDIRDGGWRSRYNWSEAGPAQDVCAKLLEAEDARSHGFPADLVITNPDFGIVYECLPLWLKMAPVVVLYCKDDLGQRSTTKGLYGTLPTPCAFARIPGAVFHRMDPKTGRPKSDSRSYGWWAFLAPQVVSEVKAEWRSGTNRWISFNLPKLPGAARRITAEEIVDPEPELEDDEIDWGTADDEAAEEDDGW